MRFLSALPYVSLLVLALGVLDAWHFNSSPVGALSVAAHVAAAALCFLAWRHWQREVRTARRAMGSLAEYRTPSEARSGSLTALLLAAYDTFVQELAKRHASDQAEIQRYSFMTQHTDDVVMQVDSKGKLQYASAGLREQLGFAPDELLGTRILERLHPEDRAVWLPQLKQSFKDGTSVLLEGRWQHQAGHYVVLEMSLRHAYGINRQALGTIAMSRNVGARNALRNKLELAARTDGLTGLLNRASMVETLERLHVNSAAQPFGLFLFDLDRFKQVNDSLGHAAGDSYLIETARRVSSVLRENDILARMGGDEFVAIFSNAQTVEALQAIAARIVEEVSKPYLCHGELLFPKTSIGILLCDDPTLEIDELISRADRAMYVAKSQGGNLAVVYDATQADTLRQSFLVEQELTLAMEEGRLALQFQPIVDAKTKTTTLAEALVRMHGTDGKLIGPGYFIEVAEKSGLIFQVGAWVLEQACMQARRLEEAGFPVSISVNVSPRQLMHVNYVQSVEAVLARTGVKPTSIVLEVTESGVMQDVNRARDILTHLRSLGFKLALDDFGSGYSSISMLKSLPFDILKIDRVFAADAEGAGIGPSTLGSIIDIGKSLNLTIIAEGIETEAQSLGLERLGCDLMQGFLFHRPLDADVFQAVVVGSRAPLVTGQNSKLVDNEVLLFEDPVYELAAA